MQLVYVISLCLLHCWQTLHYGYVLEHHRYWLIFRYSSGLPIRFYRVWMSRTLLDLSRLGLGLSIVTSGFVGNYGSCCWCLLWEFSCLVKLHFCNQLDYLSMKEGLQNDLSCFYLQAMYVPLVLGMSSNGVQHDNWVSQLHE